MGDEFPKSANSAMRLRIEGFLISNNHLSYGNFVSSATVLQPVVVTVFEERNGVRVQQCYCTALNRVACEGSMLDRLSSEPPEQFRSRIPSRRT